jgi:hypothetical protein
VRRHTREERVSHLGSRKKEVGAGFNEPLLHGGEGIEHWAGLLHDKVRAGSAECWPSPSRHVLMIDFLSLGSTNTLIYVKKHILMINFLSLGSANTLIYVIFLLHQIAIQFLILTKPVFIDMDMVDD